MKKLIALTVTVAALSAATSAVAQDEQYCNDEGFVVDAAQDYILNAAGERIECTVGGLREGGGFGQIVGVLIGGALIASAFANRSR